MIIITHFNTSHVTVYRPKSVMYMSDIQNFNTSHVTVYRGWSVFFRAGSIISIHPMLRFINSKHPAIHQNKNFNTSHVTVYHYRKIIKIFWCHYFNTSHVTVYLMILSHFYLGIFHHFLYFTSFQHFLPADYKI